MSVIEEIAAERSRQVEAEGWTLEHDDKHACGELAMAAAIYASPEPGLKIVRQGESSVTFVDPWPWWHENDTGRSFYRARAWWKPKDRRRDLIRAAALIVAEIERLDRASAKHTPT